MAVNQARPLSRQDVRTLLLSALGGALEFYDFIIFVFFTAVIAQLFFPPDLPEWMRQLQTFGIFAAGYLIRPVGGILMAHFGDLFGRKRVFMLSVLLMAIPTLLIGLLPTYAVIGIAAPLLLLLMRLLQGAAVGGEVPGAWVFVAEHVPHRIGLACGVLTSGLTLGILLGSLVASAIYSFWTPEQILGGVWRLPFLLGGVLGLLAVWLRRYLSETPIFEELRRRRALVEGLPIRRVLAGHGRSVIQSMLLTWLLTAGIVVVILMTPTLVGQAFSIDAGAAQRANSAATLALVFSTVGFGLAVDRFGALRVMVIGAIGMAAAVMLLYAVLRWAPGYFLAAYVVAGLAVGVTGVVPVMMVKRFPAEIRFSGISFSYNVAYAISGGLTPLIVTLWMAHSALAPVWYVITVCAVAVATLVWIGSASGARRLESDAS